MSAILVDPIYNPNFVSQITSATKLSSSVSISKFLGAYGDRTSFNFTNKESERKQIARNLYMQAQAMESINGNQTHFNDVRLIVSEGIFNGRNVPAVGDNKKKQDGELIYYQVIGRDGNIDFEKTFDVAVYWKDFISYGELRLDYDQYNPDGTLCVQIGLWMPKQSENYDAVFNQEVSTYFNNELQSKGELVEILPTDG
jgi:hypothetical protein|tara:strand:- start:12136 stop:12732 length:597 start_codon:yes stop_codon:yes gene_type:complete